MQVCSAAAWLDLLQISEIAAIHRIDMIIVVKIIRRRLLCAKRAQIDATRRRGSDHATIGRRSNMPRAGSGAIYGPIQTLLSNHYAGDAVSRGRAANITETDEEETLHAGLGVSKLWRQHAAFDQLFADLNGVQRRAFSQIV